MSSSRTNKQKQRAKYSITIVRCLHGLCSMGSLAVNTHSSGGQQNYTQTLSFFPSFY